MAHTPRARGRPRGSRHRTETGPSRQPRRSQTTPNGPPEASHGDPEEAETTAHDHTSRSSESSSNSRAQLRQKLLLNRPFVRQPRVEAAAMAVGRAPPAAQTREGGTTRWTMRDQLE